MPGSSVPALDSKASIPEPSALSRPSGRIVYWKSSYVPGVIDVGMCTNVVRRSCIGIQLHEFESGFAIPSGKHVGAASR